MIPYALGLGFFVGFMLGMMVMYFIPTFTEKDNLLKGDNTGDREETPLFKISSRALPFGVGPRYMDETPMVKSITVGDSVKKKSGRPFQNCQRVAVVQDITNMIVPTHEGFKTVKGLKLEGCEGLVEAWRCELVG